MAQLIKTIKELQFKNDEIKEKLIDYHRKTGRSHVGGSLSCVEIMTSLYYWVMEPPDSFILSKGHASSILYVILHDKGLIPSSEFYDLEEHPTLNKEYGIEATTGSLGHGLSLGLGMALAEKKNKHYVLMSDGECDEGQVWEAARLASELKVKNLAAVVDCNGWQAFKKADYQTLDTKFSAFGWKPTWCDGHNIKKIIKSLKRHSDKPQVILAKTIKANGISELEDTLESHYKTLSDEIK